MKTNQMKLVLEGLRERKLDGWHPVVDIRYIMFKMRDIACKVPKSAAENDKKS